MKLLSITHIIFQPYIVFVGLSLLSILLLPVIFPGLGIYLEDERTKKSGYVELYYRLLPHANWGDISIFCGTVVFFYQGFYIIAELEEEGLPLTSEESIFVIAITIILFTILIFFWAISKAAVRLSMKPDVAVPQYVVKLLFFIERPYSNKQGLLYQDLRRLQSIAETEQNSADWRSNTVTIGLISVISLIFWIFQQFPTFISPSEKRLSPVLNEIFMSIPPNLGRYQWLQNVLGVIICILLALWIFSLLIKWVLAVLEYITSEVPNRIINLACQESIFLLESLGLESCQYFTLTEKKIIAEQLGYIITNKESISMAQRWEMKEIRHDNGETLYIIPAYGPRMLYSFIGYINENIKTLFIKFLKILQMLVNLLEKRK